MRKVRQLLATAMVIALGSQPTAAQQAPAPTVVEDTNALIKRMEERLRSLDRAAKERDEALGFLAKQVEAAQGAIDGSGQTEAALRQGAAALSTRLDEVASDRERLSSESASDSVTIEGLQKQLAALSDALGLERSGRASATEAATGLREQLTAAAAREQELQAAVGQKDQALADLQQRMAALEHSLGEERTGRTGATEAATGLREQLAAAVAREQELHAAAGQKDQALADVQQRMAALERSLGEERTGRTSAAEAATGLREQLTAAVAREQELQAAVGQKDQALGHLRHRLAALESSLGDERAGRVDAQGRIAALQSELDAGAQRERKLLQSMNERDRQVAELREEVSSASEREKALGRNLSERESALVELQSQVAALGDALAVEREGRQEGAGELVSLRKQLEGGAAREKELAAQLDEREKAATGLRGEVEAKAADVARLAQEVARQRDEREKAAAGLRGEVEAKAADVARLADQVAGLRGELERTRALLGGQEQVAARQETEIASLNSQLKAALESEIQELSQYRSEFFGRLRQALGDRGDVRIVGDRFVFQAEVLFGSGSARLGEAGEAQLRQLAATLQEVAATIPPDVGWILRVDGHTDKVPIGNALFASNWELSTARAIAVVEFLVRQGIPPERLAAAGFGEYQPLETVDDEIAYRRNRRIEFKLTER